MPFSLIFFKIQISVLFILYLTAEFSSVIGKVSVLQFFYNNFCYPHFKGVTNVVSSMLIDFIFDGEKHPH